MKTRPSDFVAFSDFDSARQFGVHQPLTLKAMQALDLTLRMFRVQHATRTVDE